MRIAKHLLDSLNESNYAVYIALKREGFYSIIQKYAEYSDFKEVTGIDLLEEEEKMKKAEETRKKEEEALKIEKE